MDQVNKTLYIPLYGKALVSRLGIILRDESAEKIWAAEGFRLKGKAKSKWLAYNMGMRAAVFDRWLAQALAANPDAVVLHLGCGLDSRVSRVKHTGIWYDVDFPEVIAERKRYFGEDGRYHMLGADIREMDWLDQIPGSSAIVVMEGLSMYLRPDELRGLMKALSVKFHNVRVLMDAYTVFAARATKYKNPINEVGVTQVFGFDDPQMPTEGSGLVFASEHDLIPEDLITQLKRGEQGFFRLMFAGKMAKAIYRLYEYETK